MATLESKARAVLLPMMRGTPTQLSPDSRRMVAAWATKTTFMFLHAWNTPRSAPLAERQWLFRTGEPAPNVYVWFGAFASGPILAAWSRNLRLEDPSDLTHEGDAEVTTIAINELVIQILVARFPVPLPNMLSGYVRPVTATADRDWLLDVWPDKSGATLQWPPSKAMNAPTLRNFVSRFTGAGGPAASWFVLPS